MKKLIFLVVAAFTGFVAFGQKTIHDPNVEVRNVRVEQFDQPPREWHQMLRQGNNSKSQLP